MKKKIDDLISKYVERAKEICPKRFDDDFVIFPRKTIRQLLRNDIEIAPITIKIYLFLLEYIDCAKRIFFVTARTSKIAESMGVIPRTVSNSLTHLETIGLITTYHFQVHHHHLMIIFFSGYLHESWEFYMQDVIEFLNLHKKGLLCTTK